MNPHQQFQIDIEAATHYQTMYKELRSLKGLSAKGKLSTADQYLMWLPRAMVVASLSALDAYVHQIAYERIPNILSQEGGQLSSHLKDLIVSVSPLKKAGDVGDSLRLIKSKNGPVELANNLIEKKLQFESYQAPDRVVSAFRLIGVNDVFAEVVDGWPDHEQSRDEITKRLSDFVKRRNQIAHEGDLTSKKQPRAITLDYGLKCQEFIKNLVDSMNAVVL